MDLKDRVCSFELAKRLRELGEPQDSYWCWYNERVNHFKSTVDIVPYYLCKGRNLDVLSFGGDKISAPSVAELGEMLPQFFIWEHSHMSQKNVFVFNTEKVRNGKEWFVDYQDLDGNSILHFLGHYKDKIQDKSEANARAKMRIFLLENKLVPNVLKAIEKLEG